MIDIVDEKKIVLPCLTVFQVLLKFKNHSITQFNKKIL